MIRKVSAKKASLNAKYKRIRDSWIVDHTVCMARLKGCQYHATDVHHKAGKVGDLLTDTDHWLPVCRKCHTWITEHSREAIELGLSERRV